MTNKEAIKVLSSWAECKYKPTHDAACLAIAALRAQAEAEKNDPLTLEELREMDGEKIYVHYIDGFYTDEDGAYFGKHEQLVRDCEGMLTACDLPLKYYGKTWLAYRRRPEEGTN